MKSRLLTSTNELAKVFGEWCAKAEDIRIVTAWGMTDCLSCKKLTAARGLISTLIVGLDFYTTSPSFLKSFRSQVRIGKALGKGTFHPKLYFFGSAGKYCCVLGSSNFTSGGFGDNTELNVCIEGSDTDPFFSRVSGFIDEQEEHSDGITRSEIAAYRKQLEALAAARSRLAKFRAGKEAQAKARVTRAKQAAGDEPPEQLNETWREFAELILAGRRRRRVTALIIEAGHSSHNYSIS